MTGERGQATWDYVIVGAGSTGSVLAERLSRDPAHKVLLVEAGGPDTSPLIHMPKGIVKLVQSPAHIWAYQVEQPRTPGSNVPEVWIRGKGMGGSSSINGMIWSRGEPEDYDIWGRDHGCTGWNGASMTAAFKAIEDHALGESDMRGKGGAVRITPGTQRYPLAEAMIAAGRQMGFAETDDLNSMVGDRVGYYSHNIRRGRRDSGAQTFVKKARKRANFHAMTHTLVRRVVIEQGRVTGIELVDKDGARWIERVAGEVIVCAGTMESPQVLERSGIGDGAVLRGVGIETLVDSPDVGNRMREHLSYALAFRLTRNVGINRKFLGLGLVREVLRYYLTRTGAMAYGPFEVGAFCNAAHPDGRTDLQVYMGGYVFALSDDNHPVSLGVIDPKPGLSVYGQLLRPTSEGSVHVRTTEAGDNPSIIPNWLSTEYDRDAAIKSVRLMRQIAAQPALADVMGEELQPGGGVESDEDILDNFRRNATSGLHGTGTCRMGADERAVVDPSLRVRGVTGLRVADCSVMPDLITGNTNAPAMALGWRAADIILAERKAVAA